MTYTPLPRAGHGREQRGYYGPLKRLASTDQPDSTESGESVSTGPHNRRPYGVCPTCNTELTPEDKRLNEVVCPECDTLVPIVRPAPRS